MRSIAITLALIPQAFTQEVAYADSKTSKLLACDPNGTAVDQLLLSDPTLKSLVATVAARTKPDDKGTSKVTGTNVEASMRFAVRQGHRGGCPGGLVGYDVGVALTGSAAADYELVGIAGWDSFMAYDPKAGRWTPGSGVVSTTIARGAKDEWLRFFVQSPGGDRNQHVGVVWRKRAAKPDEEPLVVAAMIPPEPSRAPGPVCDPDSSSSEEDLDPAIDVDRAIRIDIVPDEFPTPGVVNVVALLDQTAKRKPTTQPTASADFGTVKLVAVSDRIVRLGQPARVIRARRAGDHQSQASFLYDARCIDGKILPRRATIRIGFPLPLDDGKGDLTLKGTLALQIKPTGEITKAR